MGWKDWIPNRGQQHVAEKPKAQKPQNAKQMYARQDGQEQANRTPLDRMPPEQRAQVDAIKAKLEKATQHIDGNAQRPSPASSDSDGGREAARQNMAGQEKTAPALSPTSVQAGKTAQEKPTSPSQETPRTDKRQSRPQTVPRPKPSWER